MKCRSPTASASRLARNVMLTLWNSSPLPVWPMPSCSRTGLRGPSAAIRYCARTVRSSPVSRLRSSAVTPSASCSKEISSVLKRRSPPSSRAARSRTGSRSFWLHRHHALGLNRASRPPGSISRNSHSCSSPVSEGVCRMPWFAASTEAASRIAVSIPATRYSSIVRTLLPRPRGWCEVSACFSTSRCLTPSRPRKRDADNPTSEPPTISTGTRSSTFGFINYSSLYGSSQSGCGARCRPRRGAHRRRPRLSIPRAEGVLRLFARMARKSRAARGVRARSTSGLAPTARADRHRTAPTAPPRPPGASARRTPRRPSAGGPEAEHRKQHPEAESGS